MYNLKRYMKKSPVTIGLIIICVIVYLISFLLFGEEMTAAEGLLFGGFNPVYVQVKHEYWRLVTANLIHFGLLHLVMNCYSLFGIGMFVESVLGFKRYMILILVCMFSTTGIPYVLYLMNGYGIYTVSGGISGVIFGLIGALGALAYVYKNVFSDFFRQLAPSVIVMLLISFLIPSISLSGHVSGLIGGFIATYILIKLKDKKKNEDLLN